MRAFEWGKQAASLPVAEELVEGAFRFDGQLEDVFRRYDYEQEPYLEGREVLLGESFPLARTQLRGRASRVEGKAYPAEAL